MPIFQHSCAFSERSELPSSLAIYAVYYKDVLLYIGMSWNLRQRFNKHHKIEAFYKEKASSICWQLYDDVEKCAKDEFKFIKYHKPKLNASYAMFPIPKVDTFKKRKPKELKGATSVLYIATFEHLWQFIERHRNSHEAFKQIFYATGLNVPWLKTFASGQTKEPGVVKVETLYSYLTGKEIQL